MGNLSHVPAGVKSAVPDLATLAGQINEAHKLCEQSLRSGMQHALEAGRLLIEAREAISHGGWLPWVEAHCDFSVRTAQGYIQLTKRWPELQAKANTRPVAHLRSALKLLAAPRSPMPEAINPMPAFSADLDWIGHCERGLVWIKPCPQHPGYYYVAFYRDLDTDDSDVVYGKRPVKLGAIIEGINVWDRVLSCLGCGPITNWSSEPATGEVPWYITAPGKPGRP